MPERGEIVRELFREKDRGGDEDDLYDMWGLDVNEIEMGVPGSITASLFGNEVKTKIDREQ
jgi:hypothetical protein